MMSHVLEKLPLSAAALSIMLCAGCARQQAITPPPVLERTRSVGVSSGIPAAVPQPPTTPTATPAKVAPASAPKQPASAPAPEPTLANRTGSLLKQRYIVSELSPVQLMVKNHATIAVPSLFQEAIALSKVRGKLKSQKVIPSIVSEKTTLRDGTVTIPFAQSVGPAEAAAAISDTLGVGGIQRVWAVWSGPR